MEHGSPTTSRDARDPDPIAYVHRPYCHTTSPQLPGSGTCEIFRLGASEGADLDAYASHDSKVRGRFRSGSRHGDIIGMWHGRNWFKAAFLIMTILGQNVRMNEPGGTCG